MPWKYIGEGKSIAGAPLPEVDAEGSEQLIPDEVFADAERALDARFGVTGSLRSCQHPEDEREAGHACVLYEQVGTRREPRTQNPEPTAEPANEKE